MNRIFKTVWNRVRRCYVAVNETVSGAAQASGKGVLTLGVCVLASAAPTYALEVTTGDHEYGVLSGYDELLFIYDVKNVTIEAIDSPNGKLRVHGRHEDPNPVGSALSLPDFHVLGETKVKSAYIGSNTAVFDGDVVVSGKVDNDVVDNMTAVEHIGPDGTSSFGVDFTEQYENGGIFHSSVLGINGGTQIKGDLTASLVHVSGGQIVGGFEQGTLDYYSVLTVDGNLIADNVQIDTLDVYDDKNDLLRVKGTATISHNLQNNGFIEAHKVVVGGKFMNGTGRYVGDSGADAMEKTGATIDELDAAVIENGSALIVGTFLRNDNVRLDMSYGTVTSKSNWLTNSVITMTGGYLDAKNFGTEGTLGEGNSYTVTGGTLKSEHFDGRSEVTLSGDGQLYTSAEGAFNMDTDVEVALNTIALTAQVPAEIKSTLTSLFEKYVPGDVAQTFIDSVRLQGGEVVVTGVNLTETQRDDLTNAFKEQFFDAGFSRAF